MSIVIDVHTRRLIQGRLLVRMTVVQIGVVGMSVPQRVMPAPPPDAQSSCGSA